LRKNLPARLKEKIYPNEIIDEEGIGAEEHDNVFVSKTLRYLPGLISPSVN